MYIYLACQQNENGVKGQVIAVATLKIAQVYVRARVEIMCSSQTTYSN